MALADRYQLERELGRGGMATVYLTQDLRHDRQVALKVLHPELAATLGPERFQREIRTTARLQHPHILPVLDSGEVGGQLWYTMPFVDGESLRDRLRRERQLPIEDALRITREVADALAYAHEHGVVHRDIKPENILLSRGHALVADFGIARPVHSAGSEKLTATGLTVGTPAYMSPEQCLADPTLDARSDLYSLGCVLYEMLAGETPYTATSAQALVAKRLHEPVPHIRTVRDSVPEAVDVALQRVLARTPTDRFGTASEFAEALTNLAPTLREDAPAAISNRASTQETPILPRRRSGVGIAAVIVLALAVVVAGVVFARRRTVSDDPRADGAIRLAVLPFENLGDTGTSYFADGLAGEIRGKLAGLTALEVIAPSSSGQYRNTSKPPSQIAKELGVRYLLTGRVQWERDARTGRGGRVRVSPELVDATTGATRWEQPFDAPLTDIFGMQADIAERVATALGVALGGGERERLTEKPTRDVAAYDAYLRGEEVAHGLTTIDQNALHQARDYYERAVALDSSFAVAWAQLSRTYSQIYWNLPTQGGEEAAQRAAERALALAPRHPDGYLALGDYQALVRKDYARALEAYGKGRRIAPREARLASAASFSALGLAKGEEALRYLREATALDPRSVDVAWREAWALLNLRRYAEALAAADRGLRLDSTSLDLIETKAMVYLGRGDLAGARAVLRRAASAVDPAALVAYVANYASLGWVLDQAQQRLLFRLSPAQFYNDRGVWGGTLAEASLSRGDTAATRAYADSALGTWQQRVRDVPQDAQARALLGLYLAFVGRRAEAIREGERAMALMPITRDAMTGSFVQHQVARIYLWFGEEQRALDLLEPLLRVPYWLSPGWLRIDPNFAPLRGNPRFERLVNGS